MTDSNEGNDATEPSALEEEFADALKPLERHAAGIHGVDAVRLRPDLYVGSTGFFGFIQYLVCPMALLLEQRPKRIALSAQNGGFRIETDVAVPLNETADGRLTPFECFPKSSKGLGFEGRVIEGGTHERGFADAMDRLYVKLKLPRMKKTDRNGVVGVFYLEYPDVVWEGCIKLMVGSPELRPLVRDWVVREALEWVRARPEVAEQLRHLQTFQFPEVWSR